MIEVVVSRTLAATPEAAFDAWIDPERARRFLFATPEGRITRCDIDPREGGEFTIIDQRGDTEAVHHGRFEVLDRPRRLVFIFRAGTAGEQESDEVWTRVSVTFDPTPDGCTLTLRHEMDDRWAAHEEQTRRGWTMIVEGAARVQPPR